MLLLSLQMTWISLIFSLQRAVVFVSHKGGNHIIRSRDVTAAPGLLGKRPALVYGTLLLECVQAHRLKFAIRVWAKKISSLSLSPSLSLIYVGRVECQWSRYLSGQVIE